MTARQLLEVLIRMLGVWLMVYSVVETSQWLVSIGQFPRGAGGPSWTGMIWVFLIVGVLQMALGLVLIQIAPRLASRIQSSDPQAPADPSRVGPGDLYHLASFGLGVYFLVLGIVSAAGVAMAAMSLNPPYSQLISSGATAAVYLGSGLLLVFGARRIAEMISLVRYDPDSIPQQQFSLKLLLGITVVAAVALVVLKMVATG